MKKKFKVRKRMFGMAITEHLLVFENNHNWIAIIRQT